MKGIRYGLRMHGLRSAEGTITMATLRRISDALLDGCERSLRLSVEGASVKRGKTPAWLSRSLEFTIAGISHGSTVLEIEAPTLAESAPEQVRQRDLWYSLPDPEDTAISLLSKSVSDAASERLDSERFDRGVLSALLSFEPLLGKDLNELEVVSQERGRDNFRIGRSEVEKISRLKAETPEARAIVVAGLFNLIEHKKRQFRLDLEDGRGIPGKADQDLITEDNMRGLWGKKVTIKGTAHFNPSGRIRFFEAHVVKPFVTGEEVFERIPESQSPFGVVEGLKRRGEAKSPLREVWGQWPGDESIDEILKALKETSVESA